MLSLKSISSLPSHYYHRKALTLQNWFCFIIVNIGVHRNAVGLLQFSGSVYIR